MKSESHLTKESDKINNIYTETKLNDSKLLIKSPSSAFSPSFFNSLSPFLKEKSKFINYRTYSLPKKSINLEEIEYNDYDDSYARKSGGAFVGQSNRKKKVSYNYISTIKKDNKLLLEISEEDYLMNYYTNYNNSAKFFDDSIKLQYNNSLGT